MAFGTANPRIWDIIQECGDARQGYYGAVNGSVKLTAAEKNAIKKISIENAEKVIALCEQKNISIYTYNDDKYPSQLRSIFNPPSVLYCDGILDNSLDAPALTVVGTRHPSPYGIFAVEKISSELSKAGLTIVSGFADGIDSAAHRAAIKENGRTIAVLGCGIDVDYPRANSDIRDAVRRNGALISEFLPGTPPLGRNFPVRNRILSGLSLGVFIAEAPCGSGALITADMAVEQGRDVFCLPPADIFNKNYQGVIKYLRDGAIPVFSHLDIIYEYYTTFSHKLSSLKPENEYIAALSDSEVFSQKNPDTDIKNNKTKKIIEKNYDDLSGTQLTIVKCFSEEQKHIDDIIAESGLDAQVVLTALTDLEISGEIISLPGKRYKLC